MMNYIRDLQENPEAKLTGYWKNTSDNSIIRSFIDIAGSLDIWRMTVKKLSDR